MENEKILKIIESSHFNFLIGSGASRNYLETLKNIEELLTLLDCESSENKGKPWFKILDVSVKHWYFKKCIEGNIKLIDEKFDIPVEKEEEFAATMANYHRFLQSLNILLLKRRNKLLPKEVNLFTTNMDLFIDMNLDTLGLEFNDGFSGKFVQLFNTSNYQKSYYKNSSQYNISSELPLFNLFKLHGSLTWDKNVSGEIRYDPSLSALKAISNLIFPDGYLVPLVKEIKTAAGSEWKLSSYDELKSESEISDITYGALSDLDEFLLQYEKMVMINPTKEKFENTTLRLEYYEQMRMYSNILERENSVLFVSGFSFADEHIRQITYRALNSNPTLLIIVFCFSDYDKTCIDELFPNLKYKNLYNEFIGYGFSKMIDDIFRPIAAQFDPSMNPHIEDGSNSTQKNLAEDGTKNGQ
ncbi:MAG: hypothetical protein EOP48_01190 [Sphingobacteriales bacterium]|nr:MAG: hypothetical protein EOP48_01190 [Sphingobacteriales bacterium]